MDAADHPPTRCERRWSAASSGKSGGEAKWLRYRFRVLDRLQLREMPGARRTERISQRDLEVLEFIARYGVLPRGVVARWAETGRAATAARERRLREAGLVEVLPGLGDSGRLVLCTRRGLQAVGREELSTPRFAPAMLRHSAAAARVAVQLERAGRRVLSEREIEARECAEGRRVFSVECRSGRFHRPDLVILPPDSPSASDCGVIQPIAVEVELTDKSARRLDEILRAWRRSLAAGQFGRVLYRCSARALPYLERAVARVGGEWAIDVEPLERGGSLFGHCRGVGVDGSLRMLPALACGSGCRP